MHIEQDEMKQLNAGWKVILIIWGAILASLGVYLVVCLIQENNIKINIGPEFPFTTIKDALFGVSFITIIVVYYLRKTLLKKRGPSTNSVHESSTQHPAIGKYTVIIVLILALLESIGIYGVFLFFLAKDTSSLYQFLGISALAMIHFRPRKNELLNLAHEINIQKQQ